MKFTAVLIYVLFTCAAGYSYPSYWSWSDSASNTMPLREAAQDICELPSETGPCKGFFLRFFYNAKSQTCEKFIYGGCQGNENNFKSLKECEARCGGGDVCELPSETGPCKGYFPRFFYNAKSQTCEKFIYGGCQGNGNNFKSLKECEARCGGGDDVCDLPSETGPCKAYFPRFFYNAKSQTCEPFIYGGCQGNGNNFKSLKECEARCGGGSDDVCDLPSETGPCKGYFPRLFYNAKSQTCEKFIYGGCQGNENNFKSLKECEARCGGGSDASITMPLSEDGWISQLNWNK